MQAYIATVRGAEIHVQISFPVSALTMAPLPGAQARCGCGGTAEGNQTVLWEHPGYYTAVIVILLRKL